VAYKPIEDYGIIGDLETIALIGRDGSVDLLCLPDLDSPSVFAALVDDEQGGSFSMGPSVGGARLKQLYLPDTNVLLTRFLCGAGVGEVTDFMPVGEVRHAHCLVRRVTCVRGPSRSPSGASRASTTHGPRWMSSGVVTWSCSAPRTTA
jgi:GH15 family glucan-1,4-alpha-glucosidase